MKSKRYKHLFFDLDRTLWDFESSSKNTFDMLFEKYRLNELQIPNSETFYTIYSIHNDKLWDAYREGTIEKDVLRDLRFKLTLADFGINNDKLATNLGDDYLFLSPRNVALFPYTTEILTYLKPNYALHIITNGFEEVQFIKLKAANLDLFFDTVTTSEEAGYKKPSKEIFDFSLQKAHAMAFESLMIGDDWEVDIIGAKNTGIDQVFFNTNEKITTEKATFEIKQLRELELIL